MKSPRSDVIVLLITFALTVAVDLTVAITVGTGLAILFFMKNISETVQVNPLGAALVAERDDEVEAEIRSKGLYPAGVEVFEVQGPLFFGAAQCFEESILIQGKALKTLILQIKDVHHIDATGLYAIDQIRVHCHKRNTRFFLIGARDQPVSAMKRLLFNPHKIQNRVIMFIVGLNQMAFQISIANPIFYPNKDNG